MQMNLILMFIVKPAPTQLFYASVNYSIISSDNGLLPFRRQAITLANDKLLLIGPLGTISVQYESEFKNKFI